MAFFVALALFVATELVQRWLAPKPPRPRASDFQAPQPSEGTALPVICGTVALSPSVAWWGDVRPEGVNGDDSGLTAWYGRMHFIVCWGPVDEWLDLLFDGRSLKLQPVSNYGFAGGLVPDPHALTEAFTPRFPITRPIDGQPTRGYVACLKMFGGDRQEGGVAGPVDFAWGTDGQNVLSLVAEKYVVTGRRGIPYSLAARYPRWCHLTLGIASTEDPGEQFSIVRINDFNLCNNSPYPKPLQVVVRKCPNPAALGLVAGEHVIGGQGNFACFVYHLLTDPDEGLGWPEAQLDAATFAAAARTLAAEGLGCSAIFSSPQSARTWLEDLLDAPDGILRRNPATGLLECKLARADYDVDTLPRITESNSRDLTINWGSWPETRNNLLATFNEMVIGDTAATTRTDPPSSPADGDRYLVGTGGTGAWLGQDGKVARWTAVGNQWEFFTTDQFVGSRPAIRQYQNLANRFMTGSVRTQTYDFPYLADGAAAQIVADRRGRGLSNPIAKISGKLNRQFAQVAIADVVAIDRPSQGISNLVARLLSLEYGKLEDGEISFDAIQDVFGIGDAVYQAPPPSVWRDPTPAPADIPTKTLFELPFWMTPDRDATRRLVLLAAKADPSYRTLDIALTVNGGTEYRSATNRPFACVGTLTADYPYTTEGVESGGFTVRDAGGLAGLLGQSTDAGGLVRGDRIALIANPDHLELITWETATNHFDGTWTLTGVVRAILDSVPSIVPHPLGTAVYFFWPDRIAEVADDAWAADAAFTAKALPTNSKGTLDPSLATSVALTSVSRAQAPYPAARPRLAATGTYDLFDWPTYTVGGAGVTFSWSQRSRTGQTTIIRQDDATNEVPFEGTYTIEVLIAGVVKRTVTGLTGTSFTYSPSMRGADDIDGRKSVVFRITPVSGGGIAGTPLVTPPIIMTGFGMAFGNFFGGQEP